MTKEDHLKEAKKCLAYLVNRLENYVGGDKFITYGNLAKQIGYPVPYTGSQFSNRIGTTLGVMGHLLDNIEVPDWKGRIPYMQAIVVSQNYKLPSDGLKEFNIYYPEYSLEKKRDYIKQEYKKIFEFGDRWNCVLDDLDIKERKDNLPNKDTSKKKYNPFGSEGSPEHRKLRDHISQNPASVGFDQGVKGHTEYPLKSGDSVDVVFLNEHRILGVEVKSRRSGADDHERGIYQCIKYREVIIAEDQINNQNREIDCILVHQEALTKKLIRIAAKLNVLCINIRD